MAELDKKLSVNKKKLDTTVIFNMLTHIFKERMKNINLRLTIKKEGCETEFTLIHPSRKKRIRIRPLKKRQDPDPI